MTSAAPPVPLVSPASSRAPLIAALLAVGLALGGLLVGYEPVGGDPDRIFRPIKAELARSLRDGKLPFWSDRFGLGAPLVAESHVAAFYPPNLGLYRVFDVSTAYRLAMWLHNLAIVAATYAYARQLGISAWGGALAGVSFVFSGFATIQSSHEWAYHTLAYLPLCLLAADRYATTGRMLWLALLALGWGVQISLGHFQVQSWTGGLAFLTGAWRVVADRRPKGRIVALGVGLVWGAAIAAVQLGPTWELAQIVGQTRRTFAELAFYSYPPAHWAELAIPTLFRGLVHGPESAYWFRQQTTAFEACLFVGTIPLILAFVGMIGARARGVGPWRWVVFASLALATMPRWWPSGYAAILQLPGLGYFRCPARYTAITSLGLALLAGAGLDRTISGRKFMVGMGLAIAFGLAAGVWAVFWSAQPGVRGEWTEVGLASRLGVAAASWAVALVTLILWRRGRETAWSPLLLAAVEGASLYYAGTTHWGWSIPLPESSPTLQALAKQENLGRVGGLLEDLPVRAGLITATPYLGFPLPPPYPLLKAVTEPDRVRNPFASRWLRRFGVTHEVWDSPVADRLGTVLLEGIDPALDAIAARQGSMLAQRPWRIVRLPDPFPSARAVTRVVEVADRSTLLERLATSDALDLAWSLPTDRPPPSTRPRARAARVVRWDGQVGEVEHDGTCDLVLTRGIYPGWTARVNEGPPQPCWSADGGLLAVRVEGTGTSRVAIAYQPTGLGVMATVSGVALASSLVVIGVGLARNRRPGATVGLLASEVI